jgi:predicted SprT family Zn-dependent metalloprotease|tara:strand:+ start:882 stop:1139 length:258 start_codon:yes stop_codon:yes gene_type:complete
MTDENNDKKKDWKDVMDDLDKKRARGEFAKKFNRKHKKSFGSRHKGTPKGTCIMCGKRVSPYTRIIEPMTNLTYCPTCAKRRGIK